MAYRLPKHNDSQMPQVPRRRGYRLAKPERVTPNSEPRRTPMTPFVLPGHHGHGHRPTQRTPTTRRHAFNVIAPKRDLKSLATLDLVVATSDPLPDLFGQIVLTITPDSVDLNRVKSGVLNLHENHFTDRPIGRVISSSIDSGILYGVAEIAATPDGARYLQDFDQHLKIGTSPGFQITDLEMTDGPDGSLITTVLKFEPHEYSQTSIPRSRIARATRRLSMNFDEMRLVHIDDMDGLSLEAGRRALRLGKVSGSQREKLSTFYKTFDAELAQGQSRAEAISKAKIVAGIPA